MFAGKKVIKFEEMSKCVRRVSKLILGLISDTKFWDKSKDTRRQNDGKNASCIDRKPQCERSRAVILGSQSKNNSGIVIIGISVWRKVSELCANNNRCRYS